MSRLTLEENSPRSGNVGFVVRKVELEQVLSQSSGFICHLSFHQLLHTHLSSGAGTIGPKVARILRPHKLQVGKEAKKFG
jgi:hypothetical protein